MAVAASMLGAGEAARVLGVSKQYLGELAKQGRIEFEWSPYGRVYDAADIERFQQEREAARRETA